MVKKERKAVQCPFPAAPILNSSWVVMVGAATPRLRSLISQRRRQPPVSEIKIPANDYSPLCTLTMPLPAAGQFAGGCYQQGTGHRVLLSQAGQDESNKEGYKYKYICNSIIYTCKLTSFYYHWWKWINPHFTAHKTASL